MELQMLPLGTSDFSTLRGRNQIYVDKTDQIYELARLPQKFFLSRPRRFGKSLLISTFESLFKYGLRDFSGLKIEKLWKEEKTYQVIRLDFSGIKNFSTYEEFQEKLNIYFLDLMEQQDIRPRVPLKKDGLRNFINWLAVQKSDSSVFLIDEYDAPLTACLNDPDLFEKVRGTLMDFYSEFKRFDGIVRFMFITGVTKFHKVSIFSELNNFSDLTLNPKYGTLLGYTPEETEHYFADYLRKAEKELNSDKDSLMQKLIRNYDGFCFDRFAEHRVFAPWSILKFLGEPELGFQNYWFESGGKPSALLQYMKSHILKKPDEYASEKSIILANLSGSSSVEGLSDIGLLTQAGYLTIKRVEYGTAFLGYPNEEVKSSMAQLFTEQLLGGFSLVQIGAGGIITELIKGNAEGVFQFLNKAFLSIDYKDFPVKDESSARTLVQLLLSGFGLQPGVEVHNNKGRSDLEVEAGNFHWVFEFKAVRKGESPEAKLKEAIDQITLKGYGLQALNSNLIRVAIVYSIEKRSFVKWQVVGY